jgi:hypothetical protein
MSISKNKDEQFDFQFLGLKISAKNPGAKTLILFGGALAFFIIVFILWKPAGLGAILVSQMEHIQKGTTAAANWLKGLRKGKAP